MIKQNYKSVSVTPIEVITVPHKVGHVTGAPDNTVLLAYHPDHTTVSFFTPNRQRMVSELEKATKSL
ncbi:MAG: hypothetical protein HRT89_15820, partial [Lentisphaeria bacterium]|nr:hypothetical protein [Lentisphaeria bacterium]NQZ69526.1 hypothetical protein [Lentisphaeria bacterium]